MPKVTRLKTGPKPRPLADRFNEKVDRSGGPDACWPWMGVGTKRGEYGRIGAGGAGAPVLRAHRVAWILANGEPPADKPFVLHKCDYRPCCNPSHLFVGTKADNTRDMIAKGREHRGERTGTSKLTESIVRKIFAAPGSCFEVAEQYDISFSHVRRIKRGDSWGHLGLTG